MFRGVVAGLLLVFSYSASAQEIVKSGCSKEYPGVQWFIYSDGTVGKNPKSRQCGFSRNMNLTVEGVADRFTPAVISVDYKDMLGRVEAWGMEHSDTTLGRSERVGCCTVEIYGDGRTGDGTFTLGVERIQYTIVSEPVCQRTGGVDCQGYTQRSPQEFIYYGEDDTQVVTWELGIFTYASHTKYGIDTPIKILKEYEVDSYTWNKWEEKVEKYNKVYRTSGVHVQFKLTKVYLAHWHKLRDLELMVAGLPVDIVLSHGTSYPDTCGVADVSTIFREGQPTVSMSKCDIYTDLHEIGHSVGLAHGPENQSWQQSGYIFPEFGHGWNDICGKYDDLMSYGYNGIFHSNELQACFESTPSNDTIDAGSRQWSDTAYSLNRVRYNVSLIHDENKYVEKDAKLKPVKSLARRIGLEVVD